MRNIYLIAVFLVLSTLGSCSSDDNTPIITTSFNNENRTDGSSEAMAYEIENAFQLKLLALRVNNDSVNSDSVPYNLCYYKVIKDIDMSEVCGKSIGSWVAIGTGGNVMAEETYFGGHFDGNNHTISNLYINDDSTNYCQVGLFGSVMDATIQNLNVTGNIIIGCFSEAPTDNMHFGGVVALAANSLISNCHSTVNMEVTADVDYDYKFWRVGGVVGLCWKLSNASMVDGCSFAGNIKTINKLTEPNAILTVGGVCGGLSTSNNSIIKNCNNKGSVSEQNEGGVSHTYVGGVLGSSSLDDKNNNLYNCYNLGYVEKETENDYSGVGGIVGYIAKGNTVANIYTSCGEVCGSIKGIVENGFDETNSYIEVSPLLNTWVDENGAELYDSWNSSL